MAASCEVIFIETCLPESPIVYRGTMEGLRWPCTEDRTPVGQGPTPQSPGEGIRLTQRLEPRPWLHRTPQLLLRTSRNLGAVVSK